ncbi:MAG: reverse transcriptase domain-containing protein [Planctomycetota bacterium]
MDYYLAASPDEQKQKFSNLDSKEDVANLLEVPLKLLTYILYGARERSKYETFSIAKKSGGTREISVPPKNLAILQKKLASVFLNIYQPKPASHAFLRRRSVVTNASNHVGQAWVLNIDLEDYFPSIHIGRVKATFCAEPYRVGDGAAVVISQICCNDPEGILPQGAPTSPIVSNIVSRPLDDALMRFAREHKISYSRYADDLTFSSRQASVPDQLALRDTTSNKWRCASEFESLINSCGFQVNGKKTRLATGARRQEVTGVTVNEQLNLERRYIRNIDSMLFSWSKYGHSKAQSILCEKIQSINCGTMERICSQILS